jgi:hypothetical protein
MQLNVLNDLAEATKAYSGFSTMRTWSKTNNLRMSLAAGFKASTNARVHIFKQVPPSLKEAAAFSCSKFVFFLPHAFFCLKMLFFAPLHFPHRLCVFSTSSFFTASKPFERASRFFTVHICLNPFNLLIFSLAKS